MSAGNRRSASEQIMAVTARWPGVTIAPGRRGERSIRYRRRELGHLHGDQAAHFTFPKPLWRQLLAEGRIEEHRVFPGREGFGSRRIATGEDVREAIALLRLNCDRFTAVATE